MKLRWQWMVLGLSVALSAAPSRAEENRNVALPEIFKSSINRMVKEVREAPEPLMKRRILSHYLSRMEIGLERAAVHPSLQESDREAVIALKAKFQANYSELHGQGGFTKVADTDLDSFAGFIQQDVEQAGWGSGGIYLSTGVLLIILIILLVL